MDFNIGTCKKTSREFNGQNQIGDETEQNEDDILKNTENMWKFAKLEIIQVIKP